MEFFAERGTFAGMEAKENQFDSLLSFLMDAIDDAQWAEKHGVDPEFQRGRQDAYLRVKSELLAIMGRPSDREPLPRSSKE